MIPESLLPQSALFVECRRLVGSAGTPATCAGLAHNY